MRPSCECLRWSAAPAVCMADVVAQPKTHPDYLLDGNAVLNDKAAWRYGQVGTALHQVLCPMLCAPGGA